MARMLERPPRAVRRDERVGVGMGGACSRALALALAGAGDDVVVALAASADAATAGPDVWAGVEVTALATGADVAGALAAPGGCADGAAPALRRAIFISPATWSASVPTTTCNAVAEGDRKSVV